MRDLSICIPTYNRCNFLKWTLNKTKKDFLGTTIVVSDNASTDDTRAVMHVNDVRYTLQSENIGAFPNMRAALLAADTKYCVFLADDDYLVPEEVQKGVDYLEANPDVACYFAPCQLYNEVEGKADWDAFYPGEDKKFTDATSLWNFLVTKHVWPEHAIYRRKGLEDILKPRTDAYWCFVDLGNATRQGSIYFASKPYYRNITNHPVGSRSKLGDQQCLTDFGSYRAGLEILAFDLFSGHLTPKIQRTLADNIRQFIMLRYEVAQRLLRASGRVDEADELLKRYVLTKF